MATTCYRRSCSAVNDELRERDLPSQSLFALRKEGCAKAIFGARLSSRCRRGEHVQGI